LSLAKKPSASIAHENTFKAQCRTSDMEGSAFSRKMENTKPNIPRSSRGYGNTMGQLCKKTNLQNRFLGDTI